MIFLFSNRDNLFFFNLFQKPIYSIPAFSIENHRYYLTFFSRRLKCLLCLLILDCFREKSFTTTKKKQSKITRLKAISMITHQSRNNSATSHCVKCNRPFGKFNYC